MSTFDLSITHKAWPDMLIWLEENFESDDYEVLHFAAQEYVNKIRTHPGFQSKISFSDLLLYWDSGIIIRIVIHDAKQAVMFRLSNNETFLNIFEKE